MGSSGGASYTPGGQGGPIGYNPTWNPNSGYQSWPNTGQQSDANNTAQSVQMNPQTGQPDYSSQWAEYYRSMGMHREAEMIEQQSKQAKTDQQPAPPGSSGAAAVAAAAAVVAQQQQQQQQAQAGQQQQQQGQQTAATQNGGQPDYSAQWAEYYRSIGKSKEAEAIEAQMKGGKMNMPSNQMAQPQMQQQQQPGQPGSNSAASGTPSPFPQAHGTYSGMNPGAPGYYPSGGGGGSGNSGSGNNPTQQQSGQQNPGFGGGMGYQNYPYSQQNSDN